MAEAVLSARPMPPPMSRYQLPAPSFAGSIPLAFQSRSSRALVPLLSPRETKGAFAAAMAINAAMTRIAVRAPEINRERMENFAHIIGLSLGVSLCATALATLFGLSLGAVLAVYDFPGRHVLIVLSNAFFGLPPVAVGLALYLL